MKMTRRRVLGLLAGAAAVVGVPSVWITRMKTYDGPASDHFNGTHFFDPDGSPPKSLGEVLRWQFGPGRKRAAWPEWMASPHANTRPKPGACMKLIEESLVEALLNYLGSRPINEAVQGWMALKNLSDASEPENVKTNTPE